MKVAWLLSEFIAIVTLHSTAILLRGYVLSQRSQLKLDQSDVSKVTHV